MHSALLYTLKKEKKKRRKKKKKKRRENKSQQAVFLTRSTDRMSSYKPDSISSSLLPSFFCQSSCTWRRQFVKSARVLLFPPCFWSYWWIHYLELFYFVYSCLAYTAFGFGLYCMMGMWCDNVWEWWGEAGGRLGGGGGRWGGAELQPAGP